jgi:tRNA(Ile)-lysidine synthase
MSAHLGWQAQTQRQIIELLSTHAHPILSGQGTLWLACSGGIDSITLLDIASKAMHKKTIKPNLKVVHINHQWHPEADVWAKHVAQEAKNRQHPCLILKLDTHHPKTETAAREARYQAFKNIMQPGDALMTAHHLDDQIETVLMRLFRGSGPEGLAGMTSVSTCAPGLLIRPLLGETKDTLKSYANTHALAYLHDPSNDTDQADRNYLRQAILPNIAARWPQYKKQIANCSALCAQTDAKQHLASGSIDATFSNRHTFPLAHLKTQPQAMRLTALRTWLITQTQTYPTQKALDQLDKTVVQAALDAQPEWHWQTWIVRRHRAHLYLHHATDATEYKHQTVSWQPEGPIIWQGKTLYATRKQGAGLLSIPTATPLTLRPRPQNLRFHAYGTVGSRPLKKHLQDWGIPPWARTTWPFVFLNDTLIAVPSYAVAACHATKHDDDWGLALAWETEKNEA